MSFSIIIPARYSSSRLPAKPLKDIAGKPMIQRVYEQALLSEADQVYVATDDDRIVEVVQGFNGNVLLTDSGHPSGTDRLQQAASLLGLGEEEILVNVQGDEPLIPPSVINQVAANLSLHQAASAATLCEDIESMADFENPNIVKVVSDSQSMALYFSRAPIPWPRDAFAQKPRQMPEGHPCHRHIGIYAYRVGLLNQFVRWQAAPLEGVESLEQLRILHHGAKIHVAVACDLVPGGVDTEEDLAKVRARFASNPASAS
ncbi:3-deoxy-manno-octulosonate cytidylyltransferase [Halioxenophilus sp. WMMB6]|uniref:3-deoxy-manno-octulosonate cytidylyltransferase n=1 Tax=Halioxenophilus sp. WMMB6 TaxID=3073815 RepID=UPI00295E9F13|nr:3-deoxy-manno-octulosonate cytidylyltransferase [Halioxenophilus sp. WMMB6]